MENIRKGLAKAHANALSSRDASVNNPVILDRSVFSDFHRDVFIKNGAGDVFGGDIPFVGNNIFFRWCSLPGCRP